MLPKTTSQFHLNLDKLAAYFCGEHTDNCFVSGHQRCNKLTLKKISLWNDCTLSASWVRNQSCYFGSDHLVGGLTFAIIIIYPQIHVFKWKLERHRTENTAWCNSIRIHNKQCASASAVVDIKWCTFIAETHPHLVLYVRYKYCCSDLVWFIGVLL